MFGKKKQDPHILKIDEEISWTLSEMNASHFNGDDERYLALSKALENLYRVRNAVGAPGLDQQIKNCLSELESARLKGDVAEYNKWADSLDKLTKSSASLAMPDKDGFASKLLDGAITLIGTVIVCNFDRLHVIPRNGMEHLKFLLRRR